MGTFCQFKCEKYDLKGKKWGFGSNLEQEWPGMGQKWPISNVFLNSSKFCRPHGFDRLTTSGRLNIKFLFK